MHRIEVQRGLQKAVEHAKDLFDSRKPSELLQKADRIGFFRHVPGGILRLAHESRFSQELGLDVSYPSNGGAQER